MLAGTSRAVHPLSQMTLLAPAPAIRQLKPLKSKPGGGGAGQGSQLPSLKGLPPKPAPRVFTTPLFASEYPVLVMEASPIAPDAWAMPASAIGNPLGVFNGGSPGKNGGIGGDGGVGLGGAPGPGSGNDADAYVVGRGITAPSVLSKTDPEYSEEARKAKYSGAVLLSIVVNTDGRPDNIRVVRSLGMGLDEKAIEAVGRWRFRPGTNNGVPVRVRAQVEVNFRLL
jgi:TonB family protein